MHDGMLIPADIYRPKDTSKKYPGIWVRTPYNFNYWDIALGAPRDMTQALTAVKRGYAFIDMQERGHFFAEGNYDILGPPVSDGDDEVTWMTHQPWSNGKVGTTGCSSTAEWQGAVVAHEQSRLRRVQRAGLRRRRGPRGPVLRAGQLVPRRRGADALHRLARGRAEPGAARCSRPTRRRKT